MREDGQAEPTDQQKCEAVREEPLGEGLAEREDTTQYQYDRDPLRSLGKLTGKHDLSFRVSYR